MTRYLTAAVEGVADEAVARRLVHWAGMEVAAVYGGAGKHQLDRRLPAYARAARLQPWLVLRDLDHDADCAPSLRRQLLDFHTSELLLRIPVRAVDAWLLADVAGVIEYFRVRAKDVPEDPEALDRPKRSLVDLARRSRRRAVRRAMVPEPGLSAEVGVGYTGTVLEFVQGIWSPERAAERSDSLRRCLAALRRLASA